MFVFGRFLQCKSHSCSSRQMSSITLPESISSVTLRNTLVHSGPSLQDVTNLLSRLSRTYSRIGTSGSSSSNSSVVYQSSESCYSLSSSQETSSRSVASYPATTAQDISSSGSRIAAAAVRRPYGDYAALKLKVPSSLFNSTEFSAVVALTHMGSSSRYGSLMCIESGTSFPRGVNQQGLFQPT